MVANLIARSAVGSPSPAAVTATIFGTDRTTSRVPGSPRRIRARSRSERHSRSQGHQQRRQHPEHGHRDPRLTDVCWLNMAR
jgi:hypothetical protein